MRKVFCLFSIVLILVLSVVPAFAAGQSSDLVYHSYIKFDEISGSLDPSMKITWPLNSAHLDQNNIEFSLYDDIFCGRVSTTDLAAGNMLSASFTLPLVAGGVGVTESLVLTSKSIQVIPRGNIASDGSYEIYANSAHILISDVRLTGQVAFLTSEKNAVTGSSEYCTSFYTFDKVFQCPDNIARIGEFLNTCLNEIAGIDGQYYVLLDQFKVEMNVVQRSVSTPQFFVSCELTPNIYNVAQWVSMFDLNLNDNVIGDPEFNFFSWLLPVLGSILNFEIAPGISVNILFTLILLVGLVLWFIKIVS